MISHSHKFIFIHNGKCAGTSIVKSIINDNPGMEYEEIEHSTLSKVTEEGSMYKDYFKICSIRNPWDRQVSWYYHLISIGMNVPEFNQWVNYKGGSVLTYPDINKFDFFIKFENLENDYEKMCMKFSLNNSRLLKIDHNTKRPNRKYQEHYDDNKSINMVKDKNLNIIRKFNYDF